MSDCIISPYAQSKSTGYAQIGANGKTQSHHRYVYIQAYGEPPEGMLIRHTCDNRACINLEHLIPGTHQDNMDDMISRGRARHPSMQGSLAGEAGPNAKLTWEEVTTIREMWASGGYYQDELAARFEVSVPTISEIVNNKKWQEQYRPPSGGI